MNRAFSQVTVVTVTYNSSAIIDALARTLDRFQNVIAIDNASRDGTAAALMQRLPQARVIGNTANLGFGPANNQAVSLEIGRAHV